MVDLRAVRWRWLPSLILVGGVAILACPSSQAQGLGRSSGSLGGYGARSSLIDSGMSPGSGSAPIPYAGGFGGFLPSRMSEGYVSFQPRPMAAPGSVRPSFSLSTMSVGSSRMSGGMPSGLGARTLVPTTFGPPLGLGLGGGMGGSGPRSSSPSMSVMPPSFAYPFRQPPSLVAPTSNAAMSM